MATLELYRGTRPDNILSILREGLVRPQNGQIYVGRFESQFHWLFQFLRRNSSRATTLWPQFC
jgi:hypothetical protein